MKPEAMYVTGNAGYLLQDFITLHDLELPTVQHALSPYTGSRKRIPHTLWEDALQQISRTCALPALGVHIGQCVKPHHSGILGYIATASDTLMEALIRFARFHSLLHNLNPVFVHEHMGIIRFGFYPLITKVSLLSDAVILSAIWHMIHDIVGAAELRPTCIKFTHAAPRDADSYEQLFGCPVHFNCESSHIELQACILSHPLPTQDRHLLALLEEQAEAQMRESSTLRPDRQLAEIQRQITDALKDGEPTAERIATRLKCSPRTLHYQLGKLDLTYRDLLNSVRHQLACHYLADEGLSLAEISLLLGYSEQSSFTRAFKIWAGCSPSDHRRSLPRGDAGTL